MPEDEQDHVVDLIPAYSLGILDAAEADAVSHHLDGCDRCRAELAAYDAVVDLLPLAAAEAEPSAALKRQLMTRVHDEPLPAGSVAPPSSERGWWPSLTEKIERALGGRRWQPVTLLIIVALVVGALLLWRNANRPDGEEAPAEQITLSGADAAPEASGVITVAGDGLNGTLIVDNLPQLDPDSQYQLWLVKDGERADGGVFSVDEEGSGSLEIESVVPLLEIDVFGVTVEPAGGSPGPTGDRVLGSNL